VLGGLITDEPHQMAAARVPGLGDLPLVGAFFQSRNAGNTQRTLFVFLRPTMPAAVREDITEASRAGSTA